MERKGNIFALARIALLALLSLLSGLAAAAELGKATVRSHVGQPLDADVEIVELRAGEASDLTAHAASRQAHWMNNVDFTPAVETLKISIVRRAGRPVLHLRTTSPVRGNFFEALIVLRSSAGSVVRKYRLALEQSSPAPQLIAPAVTASQSEAAAEKAAPASRDELFGLTPAAAAAPAEAKQGLEWHGFVQNTTAYDYQDPEHWSRAVVRTQLGTQGGSGNFKWKASARLDVDPVYFNSGFYPEAVRKDQRADFMLRETYVDTSVAGLQLRLGKQHIVWGEMVGLFFADVVSARDQRDFILPDFDIIRIPQWAARVEYFGEDTHAEVIWLPYPEVDNIGKPGAEFYPFQVPPPPGFAQEFNNDVRPERNVKNSNLGIRGSILKGGWDLSAFYYRSIDVNPTFYREVVAAPTPSLIYTPRHDRIWQVGGTLGKDFRSFVAKAEVIYTAGRKYNVTRLSETDGVVPQDTLDYVLGLDFTFGQQTRLNLQYFDRIFYDHDPDLLQDSHEGGVSVLLNSKLGDSFYPELLLIQSVNRDERLARMKLGWTPSANWRLTLGVDVFHGPVTGFFGRFDGRNRVYGEARYDF